MGFGRTGRWFGVDHWDVVPDMMTMAKGMTSGYAPMGAVAMTDAIAQHFDHETLWCGLTCYAHPVSCAAAKAAIDVYEEKDLVGNAARLGVTLAQRLAQIDAHPSVGDVRNLGLFGAIEFSDGQGNDEGLKRALRDRRLHLLVKENKIFIAPPLCITEAQLNDGLDRIADALEEIL